jgi:hypothetical protein
MKNRERNKNRGYYVIAFIPQIRPNCGDELRRGIEMCGAPCPIAKGYLGYQLNFQNLRRFRDGRCAFETNAR